MIAAALARAAQRLAARSDSARLDAELLLAQVLRLERSQLLARSDQPLGEDSARLFAALIERRAQGEPVAYLLGRREFWTLELEVSAAVLVPRPETELVVELALARLPAGPARVLDLGTGSGAIGLAIARECPGARVDLVDASAAALAVAEQNRTRLRLGNARALLGDWYAPVAAERYRIIVANPPYLARGDPHLELPELAFEPRDALVAGPSGLEALSAIAAGALAHLENAGILILEHGATQGEACRRLLAAAGLESIETHRDLASLERATLGVKPG